MRQKPNLSVAKMGEISYTNGAFSYYGGDFVKTQDFYYDLPEELIAKTPLEQRDSSRLFVLDKNNGSLQHRHFFDIIEYLQPGDCLVLNNSRVLPARLIGHRPTGGAVEVLLLRDLGDKKW